MLDGGSLLSGVLPVGDGKVDRAQLFAHSGVIEVRLVPVPGGYVGKELSTIAFAPEDRVTYRTKVRRCLDVLAQLLDEDAFVTTDGMTGLEIELNLVDDDGRPAMRNAEVLGYLADPTFQTE